jgi:hypothetical protein
MLLCAAGVLSWLASALAASALLALALGRAAFTLHDRWQSRSLADRLLRSHPSSPLSPLAAWRAEELTSEPTRKQLGAGRGTLRRESERYLDPGPWLFRAASPAGINEAPSAKASGFCADSRLDSETLQSLFRQRASSMWTRSSLVTVGVRSTSRKALSAFRMLLPTRSRR